MNGYLYFSVPTKFGQRIPPGVPIRVYAFKRGTLIDASFPFTEPTVYSGKVWAIEAKPGKSLEPGLHNRVVDDIDAPIIEPADETLPECPAGAILFRVSLERAEHDGLFPLFHSGDEPQAMQVLDVDGEYDADPWAETDKRSPRFEATIAPFARTGLIAQVSLNVPFAFMYPSRLARSLEDYGDRQAIFGNRTPCKVIVKRPRATPKYLCLVRYVSSPKLMQVIYTP